MEKGYGINLNFGINQKRLWFMGEDNKESEENWKLAVKNLDKIQEESIEFNDFLKKVKENFNNYNFIEYKL